MESKFIVIEGVEGAGKTTLGLIIKLWLKKLGVKVFSTQQPGGTDLGKDIRQMLLHRKEPIDPLAELFLYQADRAQHVAQEVRQALKKGEWVVCDRYIQSTVAYQGYGRGLDINQIEYMSHLATKGLRSDLTIILDLDPVVSLKRLSTKDAIEAEDITFHQRVRQGYLELAALDPDEIVVIDASPAWEEVWFAVKQLLQDKILYWSKIEGESASQWDFD